MTPKEQEIETNRTGWFLLTIAGCAFGAIFLTGYSTYHWLRYGISAMATLASVTDTPQPGWVGAQYVQPSVERLSSAALLMVAAWIATWAIRATIK